MPDFQASQVALDLVVVRVAGRPKDEDLRILGPLLDSRDNLQLARTVDQVEPGRHDAVVVVGACGHTPMAASLAETRIPCMAVGPPHCFHPYHAAFYRDLDRSGGVVLPACDPEEIAASLLALRARKALRKARLLVVSVDKNERRTNQIDTFTDCCRKQLGVEVIRRSTDELQALADRYDDRATDAELDRWYDEVLDGPGEMDRPHMRRVAKLYLAEKEMIDDAQACGITVNDMGGFLQAPQPRTMPNVSYGPLVFEGYLAAEEGDIEVLTSELILRVALGGHPTMSNIYLAYRDCLDPLADCKQYTAEMELADYRQCVRDNHVTAAHFSASGVLAPEMMEESRYRVRETLPAWPGQSMIVSTPKLGQVVMARLAQDASGIHLVSGEVDKLGFGDHYGWYRGRWFIKIPSVSDFVANCLHQHYAIGGENGNWRVLEILAKDLLRLALKPRDSNPWACPLQ